MLKVALINQTTNTLGTPNGVTEALMPKLEVSYEYIDHRRDERSRLRRLPDL